MEFHDGTLVFRVRENACCELLLQEAIRRG